MMMNKVLGTEVAIKLREELQRCYGLDINEAQFYYSTTNCAFIFEGSPYMIRVSFRNPKSKADIMNEVLWVDDIKTIADTICEPKPSLNNKLMEEYIIDGQQYRACMFRTAKGNVITEKEMTPLFFVCVGDLMGKIHSVSYDEQMIGFHLKRDSLDKVFTQGIDLAFPDRSVESRTKDVILDVEKQVKNLERKPETYGLCHGDMHLKNFFADRNNIWLFDFDSCTYADYMYDVATFILMSIIFGYGRGKGKNIKNLIQEDMLPYIKIGYEFNKKPTDEDWNKIALFMRYRMMDMHMHLLVIDDCGVAKDLSQIKQVFSCLAGLEEDEFFDGLTKYFA